MKIVFHPCKSAWSVFNSCYILSAIICIQLVCEFKVVYCRSGLGMARNRNVNITETTGNREDILIQNGSGITTNNASVDFSESHSNEITANKNKLTRTLIFKSDGAIVDKDRYLDTQHPSSNSSSTNRFNTNIDNNNNSSSHSNETDVYVNFETNNLTLLCISNITECNSSRSDAFSNSSNNAHKQIPPFIAKTTTILQYGSHAYVIILLSTVVVVAMIFTIFGLLMKAEAHTKIDIRSALLFDDKNVLGAQSFNFNSLDACDTTGC